MILGCTARETVKIGSDKQPLVRVGPESQPMADVDVQADLRSQITGLQGRLEARDNELTLLQMKMRDLKLELATANEQASQAKAALKIAGNSNDASQNNISVVASGGGWVLAVVALAAAFLYARSRGFWKGASLGTAKAIKEVTTSDHLLNEIGRNVPDGPGWDRELKKRGLYVTPQGK